MGKPKGRNGFFYYMLHKQQELKRNGEDLGINHPRLQTLAGDEWKAMTKEQRLPFDSRAKSEKERSKAQVVQVPHKTYNERQENLGRAMALENNQLDNDEDRELYLDKMIECCVKACKTKEDLLNASFFVMSSNVMIKTDANEYYPLEIGICQYTLKDGIKFTYHEFIDAGRVPIGYMSQAKSWAEDSHKIPFDNFYAASNNYRKIVEDIAQILDNSRFTNEISGQPTPMLVFCTEPQIPQNRGVLEWLAKKYRAFQPSFEWNLEVLDLVNLLFHVSNSINQPIPPAIAEDYLTTSAFDWSADTNCGFHEEQDNKNCARGVARRLCYMLSQALCPMFEVPFTGNHLPPKRDSLVADTYRVDLVQVNYPPPNRYQAGRNEPDNDWEPSTSEADNEGEGAQSSRPSPRMIGIGRGRGWVGVGRAKR